MPGYRAAADFNAVRTANGSAPEIHGIAFRDGTVVADTGRFSIARTITSDTLTVEAENYWSDPATLARILPGDTLVVFGRRAQGLAIRVDGGTDIAFQDVDSYGLRAELPFVGRVTPSNPHPDAAPVLYVRSNFCTVIHCKSRVPAVVKGLQLIAGQGIIHAPAFRNGDCPLD